MNDNDGLTLKQRAFVDAYTSKESFGNATKAAAIAGYKSNGVTLRSVACENLTKPNVQAAIAKRSKSIMSPDEVMEELSDVGRIKPTKNSPLNGNHKLKALELVGKAHGLFGDTTINVNTLIAKAMDTQLPEANEALAGLRDRLSAVDVEADLRLTEGES